MTEAEFSRRLAETVITHDDAQEIASRLIAGAFRRTDKRPRFTIPTRHDDDDVLILEYIRRQRIVESNAQQHDKDCIDMRYQRDAAHGSANDAWRHAAAQSLASYPAVVILRARWLESAQRAQTFATENPETPEQWRAYGAAETQFALADELEDAKFAESRIPGAGPTAAEGKGGGMTDSKYMRPGIAFAVGKTVEELGELQAALGKTIRWGWMSYNPELPEAERETNLAWVRREMRDVRGALDNLDREMTAARDI